MSERPRLLLLDGHSLAYRAFYALPVENFTTTGGQATNVVYGFANMLANVLRDEEPTHLAATFDVGRQTFRTEAFPDYKAGRSKSPGEFHSQLKILDELLAAMRVASLRVPGFEADDVIATLTTAAEAAGFEVLIITGDRDVLQLVSDDVTVLYFYRTATELIRYTPERVTEKYGLTPAQYPDFAALRGDPSDNLPGIPGIGEKTATRWIREFGSLAALLDRADEVTGKAGERLRAALDTVRLNRRLTELVRDVELPVGLDDLLRRPYDLAAFTGLLDDLEFRNASLRSRLFAADPGGGEQPPEEEQAVPLDGRELAPGELSGWLRDHAGTGDQAGAGAQAGDGAEAEDGSVGSAVGLAADLTWARGAGEVRLVALATGDGHAATFDPAGLTDADARAFAAWLADPDRPKAVHDLKALLRAGTGAPIGGGHGDGEHGGGDHGGGPSEGGSSEGGESEGGLSEGRLSEGWEVAGVTVDTALAAYLLMPGLAAYGLADLAARHLGRRPVAGGAEGLMHQARAVLDLAELFAPDLAAAGLDSVLRDVELPLAALLARAEQAGVRVDAPLLRELGRGFMTAIDEVTDEAGRIAGHPFNPGSTKQLQEVLFDELGLPKTKRIKSGHSTDMDALTWLATQTDNGLPELLLRHRDLSRLRATVAGLLREVGADGRIHSTFQQTVAATGRLTSTDPNLQVIPIRTEEGRGIRRAFLPGEEHVSLLTADYRQLELRVMAHLSQDPTLLAALRSGEDLHTTLAAEVFHVAADAVTPDMRRRIKAMSYGLAYGLSAFGLAKQLGIGVAEARPLMDAYFDRLGGVRDYLDQVVEEARSTGYTRTILGRRRYLPQLTSDDRQRREAAERVALNAPIQGSAADIVKIAMIRVDEALTAAGLRSRLLLQVHDEILLEVAADERDQVEELVRDGMTGAYPLTVALEVAIGTGPDWDAAAH